MTTLTLLGIAVGLAMDAFSVAVAVSARLQPVSPRQMFRLSFHFGLFQGAMPLVGWLGGRTLVSVIGPWDHWVAFVLLAAVGSRALWQAVTEEREENAVASDPTRGASLVALSLATSIDALAVGLSFAVLDVSVWYPCLVIGVITAGLTAAGMHFGSRVGAHYGHLIEAAGGVVLIGIGVKILVTGLLAG
jgi:putative Mn2+ efflux pump MntP